MDKHSLLMRLVDYVKLMIASGSIPIDSPVGMAYRDYTLADSTPTSSDIDTVNTLVEQWKRTVPKVQHVWGVEEFLKWAQQQTRKSS